MKIKSTILNKLILAIFIGCFIPYFLGGIYLKTILEQWLYHNNIENSKQILNQVSDLIDQSLISDMDEEASFLASFEGVKNANQGINNYTTYDSNTFRYKENDTENKIEEYFRMIKDSHKVVNFIFLGNEQGGYMEYPKFSPTKSYDPRLRPWYIKTINQDGIVMSEPYMTNVSKEMVISFTKQIKKDNKVIGVVGIAVKLDELTNSIGQIKIGDSGYVLVMSPNQKFIVSPNNPEWILKSPDELGLSSFKKLGTENEATFESKLDGIDCVFNTLTSKENGLRIISVFNKSEILQKTKEVTDILIIIYVLTFVLIFIIIYHISKRITKPILEISSVINHMTDFDFNDNTYIEHYSKRKDEIGIVSTALIDMHCNYSELMTQIKSIEDEIKNIDFEKNKQFKLKLTNSNPFSSVINSMNVLLDKLYLNFEKLIITNNEIVEKNELLTASEEELKAQFDEINQQKEHINYLAFHDSLTGLPNRRKFVEYFTNEIAANKTGAVILLDIDDFKKINDTMGHVFGDRVLEAIAKRLVGIVNHQLFISRFGGDEYLILIEYDNLIELNNYVKDICNIFNDKLHINHMEIEIRFSMGIALFPEDSTDVEQLVISADLAMYAVKNSGKNGYKYFDHSMMVNQIRSSNIETILKEAINNDGFIIVYQPEVDLKTGKIFSYEALLRLKECNLPPTAFIEVAEKNGSIINIGRIVTEKVIKQLFQWKKAGLEIKPVSVNYSAIQLHDDEYLSFMKELLNKYDIDAKYLVIEITENIFIENKEAVLIFLNQLNEMGIKIAIDDFGTGYSSLNYLAFLPVDIIKLDRSLNIKLLERSDYAIKCLISLVHSLNLIVIAEGLETIDQVSRLNEADCDYVQGFYFSKPLDADQIPYINSIVYDDYK